SVDILDAALQLAVFMPFGENAFGPIFFKRALVSAEAVRMPHRQLAVSQIFGKMAAAGKEPVFAPLLVNSVPLPLVEIGAGLDLTAQKVLSLLPLQEIFVEAILHFGRAVRIILVVEA